MKELFKEQLEKEIPLTFETLGNSHSQKYFNGEQKSVGDVVLFALMIGDVKETGDIPELKLKLIQLNERHFELFEPSEQHNNSVLPTIKLKTI